MRRTARDMRYNDPKRTWLTSYCGDEARMIAIGAVHSLFIQLTKIAAYGSLGVLSAGSVLEGTSAGLGAIVAICVTRQWLGSFKEIWFRRLAILLMLISGLSLLSRAADFFFDAGILFKAS